MNIGVGTKVKHLNFGDGIIVGVGSDSYSIYFKQIDAAKNIGKDFQGLSIEDAKESSIEYVSLADVETALENLFERFDKTDEFVPLGNKWLNGNIIIQPADKNLQAKEIPINSFFHKIVMLRDRLRVLEQNINSHKKLDDEDKVHLQQYITKCYGSLTTFNVLFKEAKHQFKGEGGEKA